MSWIRECTLVGTQGSRKEQLLKDKFDAFLNHRSPDVLLTEFLPQVRTSVDAFLGFMGIFTKYYLEKLVEAKKLDNKLMGLIIESSIVAHGHLLKWKNPRKLEYSFKLFNKLIRKLNADEIATLTKMLKSVLGKKDNILALNWTLSLLGANKSWDVELNTQRFKVLTGTFFEEQKPNAFASGVLPNIALRSVTAAEFKTHFLEEFGNLYRRNSSNVGRVLEFYMMFGKKFFSRLDETIVKEAMNPKIFEALSSKTEEVVAAAVDSVRFFAGLGKPALTAYIAQHSFNGIGERKLEAIKTSGLQIILASKVSPSDQGTTKALYKLLDNVLEGIKSEEGVAKVHFKMAAQTKTLSKRLGDAAVLSDLLVPKGEELNVAFRFVLAAGILDHCKPAESAAHFEAAKSTVAAVYEQYVKKTVVENANRLRMNNLEVLAASLLVAKFSTVSGLLPEFKQKIVEAFSAKDLEYYTEGFLLTNPSVHKLVLLELLCLLEAHLEYPSRVHDVVIAGLSADASINSIDVLKPYKLTSNFAVAFCRGLRVLKEWNWRKDRIRKDLTQIFEKIIPAIFDREQPLEVEDAHSVCDVVCGQSFSNRVPEVFAKLLVHKHHLFKSLLNYPLDMVNPINHHYLGGEGLFSLYQDRLFYYQHYVRFLSIVDLDIVFTHASIFYNPTDLKDLKLVQSRNSMVGNRSLELEDFSFKDKYKEVLEALNFLKKEKKAQAAGAGKKKAAQQQVEETVSRTREIKVDFQLLGDMEMKLIKHDTAYKDYSYILKRLSDSAALAFGDIMNQQCPRSAELMDKLEQSGLFLKLRQIAKETPLLKDAVRQLICAILKGLVLNLSHKDFGDKFSSLYFEVIASDRAAQLNRLLEESLDVLSTVKDEAAMHPAVVPILEDFSRFCFEAMFDADARRKSFDVIISMASKVKSSFLCDFIRDHLDDLYFDDVPALLNNEILAHGKTRPDILSGFLLKLLDFQFKAQTTLLSSMLELEASALAGQTIGNFEIIKLIILTKGEMKDVAKLAQDVLDRAGKKLDYHNIIELDFLRMVREIPFDLHLIAGKIISDAVSSLNAAEQKGFLQQVIKSCQTAVSEAVAKVKRYEEHPTDSTQFVDIEAAEETLGIYPVLLSCLSSHWPADLLESLFDTLVDLENNYLPNLTEKLCSAGVTFINEYKKESKRFLEIFENRLKKREGIVMPLVFLGATAKNMNKRDSNLDLISDKIIALTESADPVFQNKLGRYISRLLIFFEDPCKVVETMVQRALDEKDLSIVRAKCYSAAGIVRGLGVSYVDKLDIFGKILAITSSADKKDLKKVPKNQRYFITYILSALLEYFGRVFEPKLVEILPSLMKLFGDGDEELRDLSITTLNVAMKKLSGYGVKRILPDLVEGCTDTNTRSKLASLTALGSIAYCGAKQLAASLPDIVPQLTQATIDTNPQIKEAAVKSLNQLLSTIKTPEIVDIRETLINALSRPYDENGRALEILLNTQFSHLFDTSSIALVMPIIIYGLKNNVDNKQREDAAKVVANISNLVKEPEDIVVYLKSLTDSLIVALADILPEVRATAAKAIGRITQKLGLANSELLIQTLVKVIESEQSTAIGRTGCAQALCEALYNLGLDQIELNFSNIVAKAIDKRDHIREGYLGMLVFLPLVLDQNYERYISQTLRAAIESIAHTNEGIRNLAIKTVKTIIQKFAEKNMNQILKSLFDGMFSDSGLKRNSSVILLGDVIDGLFKEVGSQKERIFEANPEIFAALYIVKNDENPDVKYSTNNIWKSFVDNTKVVLKRINPILTQNLLDLMVSGIKYHDDIARLTMQVYIGKYGDVFIDEIVELFKSKIAQKNPKVMKGICLYLSEVFLNFNPVNLNEKRKKNFEELQMMLLNSPESNVWEAAIVCIQDYYRLAKEDQYVRDTLLIFQEDLNKADDDDSSPDFGKKIKAFGSVVKLGIAKLNMYIESLIFTTPLKPWQMEVVQNSSEIFGLKLFEKGPLKAGLAFFEDQYVYEFQHGSDKGQMLLQTIKGLAKSLTQQNEGPFVTQSITMLKKYQSNKDQNLCLALLSLEVLSQFYEYNCQESIQYLGNLLENILPLLADTGASNQVIFEAVSLFFRTKLGILSKAECASKIEAVRDTLTSIYEKGDHKMPGLLHRGAFDSLFQFISACISVGDRKICATALECADILIDVATVPQLQDYSSKFLGLLIRVANYRHEEPTKASIMDRIGTILKKVTLDSAQDTQLCTLLVYLLSEKHEEEIYKTSLTNLITIYQTKAQDPLAVVKRWAKRCAGDDRYPLAKLLDYIKSSPNLSSLESKVQSAVDSKRFAAINALKL